MFKKERFVLRSSTRQSWSGLSTKAGLLLGLGLSLLALLIVSQRILIVDTIRVWAYTPSPAISSIQQDVGFTQTGTRMFYASAPVLDGTSQFNADCQDVERGSVVLGCYAAGKIYLYDVTNKELAGIEQVTAAHEMLHAGYERLNPLERKDVDRMLETEAAKLLKNTAFKERMDVYAELPAQDRINELHAVIGTEVTSISPELEKYYQRYFKDRSNVLTYYSHYHGVFERLQSNAEKLADSLDSQATQINEQVEVYNRRADDLDADITAFNQRASSDYFTSQSQFEAARAELVARSAALEASRLAIDQALQRL